MAEYIERDALLREIEELKKSPWYNDDYGFGTKQARQEGVSIVVDLCIKQAPTADVVPVVRCKDCKYYNVYRLECHNPHHNGIINCEGYCSYGERRCDDVL